jgi:hypothetical protein
MQIRGREERSAFADSFKDVFVFRTEHDMVRVWVCGGVCL